jgi:hypothetical protein
VRVSNDPSKGAAGVFSDLLRLQTEFQARLTEETLNYLRRLQGAAAPSAPGTVLLPDEGTVVGGTGAPGDTVPLTLEIENRQRLHTVVTPMLGPLVNADGVTWFPSASQSPASMLLPPGQVRSMSLQVRVPDQLPPGTYRGPLLLQGFGDGAVAVAVEVGAAAGSTAPAGEASPAAAKPRASRRATAGSPARSGPKRPRAAADPTPSPPPTPARRRRRPAGPA